MPLRGKSFDVCKNAATYLQKMKRFRGWLAFKAHRFMYHSTLGLLVIRHKKKGMASM